MAAGIEEVVAPLGTALTEVQAQLVTRYAQKVYLLYDADAPGQKAAFRSGDELLRQGAAVHVVSLPDGEDPDSYVATHGADGLRARLDEAVDLFERKVQILERAGWFVSLRQDAEYFRSSPLQRVALVYVDRKGVVTPVHETSTPTWAVPAPVGRKIAFPDGALTGNAILIER